MKAIMVLFDSLNKKMLPSYGCDWIKAPNFERLANRTIQFNKAYAGSMPCMPARRELHTGRYNFLHRSWGPLEPFDDSCIDIMKKQGIYCHLTSNHIYYWADGSGNYHSRFNTYNHVRGKGGDPWRAEVGNIKTFDTSLNHDTYKRCLYEISKKYVVEDKDLSAVKTFQNGIEFLDKNHDADNWFLQIEAFDPHEPFFTLENYKKMYGIQEEEYELDWPTYGKAYDDGKTEAFKKNYASLVSLCDTCLGKVLDKMDSYDLWKDTMLIVVSDHGFLLGEHDYWAKQVMPWYNEIVNLPWFIWDPRAGRAGETSDCLVQTIDIPATLLDYFSIDLPADMMGKPLKDTLKMDSAVRDAALFGIFGGHINCTDGRYVYMRGVSTPSNTPLYQYTHMPAHLYERFCPEEMRTMELAEPFSFTKNCKTMKIEARAWNKSDSFAFSGYINPEHLHESFLFDLQEDPKQEYPLESEHLEKEMISKMVKLMQATDAPKEQYERIGLKEWT